MNAAAAATRNATFAAQYTAAADVAKKRATNFAGAANENRQNETFLSLENSMRRLGDNLFHRDVAS